MYRYVILSLKFAVTTFTIMTPMVITLNRIVENMSKARL